MKRTYASLSLFADESFLEIKEKHHHLSSSQRTSAEDVSESTLISDNVRLRQMFFCLSTQEGDAVQFPAQTFQQNSGYLYSNERRHGKKISFIATLREESKADGVEFSDKLKSENLKLQIWIDQHYQCRR